MINKILKKVQEINELDGLDAFFHYSGHVNSIEVSVNKDTKYIENERHNQIYSKTVYLDCDNRDRELELLLADLEEMENGL